LSFLLGFQDVTWIEVAPQGPGPVAVPQTSIALPGGIQGLVFHSEYVAFFDVISPKHIGACTYVQPVAIGGGALAFFFAAASAPVTARAPLTKTTNVIQCLAAMLPSLNGCAGEL
jgi:hypothetical protein